jgi:hypothetical protein
VNYGGGSAVRYTFRLLNRAQSGFKERKSHPLRIDDLYRWLWTPHSMPVVTLSPDSEAAVNTGVAGTQN